MNDDYGDRQRQRREEERKYQSDVWYEVWRSGGNPDAVNPDRVQDDFYRGMDAIESAAAERRRNRPPSPPVDEQYPEEQFPPEEFPPETP